MSLASGTVPLRIPRRVAQGPGGLVMDVAVRAAYWLCCAVMNDCSVAGRSGFSRAPWLEFCYGGVLCFAVQQEENKSRHLLENGQAVFHSILLKAPKG